MSILNMILPGGSGGGYQLGVLSSDKTDIDLTYEESNTTFTISYNGDGDIVIENSDEGVVSVELVSGTTYRVSGVADGDAVLTISATPTVNYFTPETVEIEVNYVSAPPIPVLNEASWEVISEVSQAGLAANYWSVGDCKAVTLPNTQIGSLKFFTTPLYVYILGINHNGSTGITFGCFKSALTGGVDVALCDSGYGYSKTSGTWFNMNNSSSNAGGWKKCGMRYYVLGSTDSSSGYNASSTTATSPVSGTFMAALPSTLRAVMKPMIIYSDNRRSSTTSVSATTDYLPLLAEYEVFGSRSYAASDESSSGRQAQYQYYKNGNSKVKYKHNATSTSCSWWLRSTYAANTNVFCNVATDGFVGSSRSHYCYGVAPIFLV